MYTYRPNSIVYKQHEYNSRSNDITMSGKTDDDAGRTRRFQTVRRTPTRRDVLNGSVIVVVVVVASLGVVVGGTTPHDVFASSEHLRLLAESERMLVPALKRYVADERQRLRHIVRCDNRRPLGVNQNKNSTGLRLTCFQAWVWWV